MAPGTERPPLIERERELAALEGAVASSQQGRGRFVGLPGAAGTGKTRLLAEAREHVAAAGMLVRHARAAELERALPLGVIRELLEVPLLELPAEDREAIFDGPATAAATAFGEADGERFAPVGAQLAVAHGLYWVAARLADRRALALLVDDVQWADPASVRALAYLAARVEEHPLLLIAAAREERRETAVGALLTTDGVETLRPKPLSADGTARLVRATIGDRATAAFCEACRHATAGNPHLLGELLATCRQEGIPADDAGARRLGGIVPASVSRTVLSRTIGLGEAASSLARAVAILERATISDAGELAELEADEASVTADRLIEAGILGPELPLEFAHPLVRAAVLDDLSAALRDRGHRRAAELLPGRNPAAAASHLLRCEPARAGWATETLRAAARDALARGDSDSALRLLERAVAEDPDGPKAPQLRFEVGEAAMAAGRAYGARAMAAAIGELDDPGERARRGAFVGQSLFVTGDLAGALKMLARATAEAEEAGDAALRDDVFAIYATLAAGDPKVRREVRERTEGRDDADPRLHAARAVCGFFEGEPAALVRRHGVAAVRHLSRLAGAEMSAPFTIGTWALAGCDHLDDADAAIERALGRAHETGSLFTYGLATYIRMWCRWRRGDVLGTLADVAEADAFAERGWRLVLPRTRWAEAECLLARGELDAAGGAIDRGFEAMRSTPWPLGEAWLHHARAGLLLARRQPQRALEEALAAGEAFTSRGAPSPAVADWRGRAVRAALAVDDAERARELAADALMRAERVGAPRTLALARLARAVTLSGAERLVELEAAAAEAERGPSPLVLARALVALGRELRHQRRRRDAREPLAKAVDLARRCGATVVADEARAELEATGARPRREPTWGPEALTPRERELTTLAAKGLSNTEIAERLFITRSTVESHLVKAFRKLEVSSRRELPEALGAER